jgi:hypothetical protein
LTFGLNTTDHIIAAVSLLILWRDLPFARVIDIAPLAILQYGGQSLMKVAGFVKLERDLQLSLRVDVTPASTLSDGREPLTKVMDFGALRRAKHPVSLLIDEPGQRLAFLYPDDRSPIMIEAVRRIIVKIDSEFARIGLYWCDQETEAG